MYIVPMTKMPFIRTPSRLKAPRMCSGTNPVSNSFGSASASYDSMAFLKWSSDFSALKGTGDLTPAGKSVGLPLNPVWTLKVQFPEEHVGFAIVMNVGRFEQILECRGWTHPVGLE